MAITVPSELTNFLNTEEQRARDNRLDEERAAALKAYRGEAYGDEEEGRSQAVTRDVSEVTDFMLTGILGVMTAGGKAVAFESEPEQVPDENAEAQAGQPQPMRRVDYGAEATTAVQYLFMRKMKGYRVLHDALKAGMLEKTGIVKTFVEQRYASESLVVPRAAIDADAMTLDGEEILSAEPEEDAGFEEALANGFASEVERPHRVVIKRALPPEVRDEAIPNEWFLVSPDTVDLDDAPYIGDRAPKSLSQLVQLGFDPEELRTIWGAAPADTVVENARDADRSTSRQSVGDRSGENRLLWFNQEYPLFDLNGDGIAERLFVQRVGLHVLRVTEVEEQPYSGWSPIPMQHRFTGQSMADKTMDIQRIRTVLLRQGLDSQYQALSPRVLLHEQSETADTIDDLLTVRPGGIIRWKGAVAPTPLTVTDTSQIAFQAMEMMSAERESRTGVTRQSQGLNPDTTNKTFGGMAMLQANADQIELYITRNFAEMLVAPMFGKRYRLMRAFMQPFRMKIEGQYATIDPSKWPADPDMQINVGLGTGSKETRMQFRQMLAQAQQAALGGGLRSVSEQEIYNNMAALIEDAGIGVPTDYWQDPSTLPPAEPQPNPDEVKAQADAAVKMQAQDQSHQQVMAKLQLQQESQQVEQALRAQQNEYDLQAKREAAAQALELARDKAAFEAAMARETADREYALARERMEREFELKREAQEQKVESGDDSLPGYRPGGSLSE